MLAEARSRSVLDSSGSEYRPVPAVRWPLTVAVVFLLALIAAPIVAVIYSLAYKGVAPPALRAAILAPHLCKTVDCFSKLPKLRVTPTSAGDVFTQTGKNNILQKGNNNQATIDEAPPNRKLTDSQRRILARALYTIPRIKFGVDVWNPSGDTIEYANQWWKLCMDLPAPSYWTCQGPGINVAPGVVMKGLHILAPSTDDKLALYFQTVMKDAGLDADIQKSDSLGEYNIRLVVGNQ